MLPCEEMLYIQYKSQDTKYTKAKVVTNSCPLVTQAIGLINDVTINTFFPDASYLQLRILFPN